MKLVIGNAVLENGEPAAIAYGSFIQNIIDFLIMAMCIFLMVKVLNKITTSLKKPEEEKEEKKKITVRIPGNPVADDSLYDVTSDDLPF